MAANARRSVSTTKRYYRISEVSRLTGVNQSTLRNWEATHPKLQTVRRIRNQRYYTPDDIDYVRSIYDEKLKKRPQKQLARASDGNSAETAQQSAPTIERDRPSDDSVNTLKGLVKELREVQNDLKELRDDIGRH